jgi:putative peptidoglycan binding protein
MAMYRRGSLGSEVSRIQQRLAELRHYNGPIDGIFGGGTEAAVVAFQRRRRLKPDGVVGPITWARLFAGGEIPAPAIVEKPLAFRVLALTGSFETNAPVPDCFAGLSGNFDDQGISFGVLQWNLGQQSLQPLLSEALARYPAMMDRVFHTNLQVLKAVLSAPLQDQLDWAQSIQDPRFRLVEPWRGMFKTLGRQPEFQDIEQAHATTTLSDAKALCLAYGLESERAVALMFDILTQNGSISPLVQAQIQQDYTLLPAAAPWADLEVERMRIVAVRRAAASRPQWQMDVRSRKLTVANGTGVVHGRQYDLEAMYGIRLVRAV